MAWTGRDMSAPESYFCAAYKQTAQSLFSFLRHTNLACTNSSKVLAFKLPLPSAGEQQQMVDYLDRQVDKIDKLISAKQSKIEKLEQYKRSLIYEYVTGKKEVS